MNYCDWKVHDRINSARIVFKYIIDFLIIEPRQSVGLANRLGIEMLF